MVASNALNISQAGVVFFDGNHTFTGATTTTANQVLLSGSSATPSWSTATYPATAGTSGNVLTSDGTNWTSAAPAGDVTGPASSTDRAIATWNGTGGNALFDNSTVTIDSSGNLTSTGATVGTNRQITSVNTDNTNTASGAVVRASAGGSSAGDAWFSAVISGAGSFSWGIDNSDSDNLKETTAPQGPSSGSVVRQMTSSGQQTLPLQPRFLFGLGTGVTNVTGTGTLYTLGSTQALTQIFNVGSAMTTAGVFTAPVTGCYSFSCAVLLTGCTVSTEGRINFTSTGTTLSVSSDRPASAVPIAVAGTCIIQMTAGDTLTFQVYAFGEAGDTVDINGNTSNTWVSGYLIC